MVGDAEGCEWCRMRFLYFCHVALFDKLPTAACFAYGPEPCWLHKGDQAACGAIIVRFHSVSNL
jgi:hypothetical protein